MKKYNTTGTCIPKMHYMVDTSSKLEKRYDALLQESQLLFTLDLIKEKLSLAYSRKDEAIMAEDIISIMDMCKATGNPHFL